MHSITLGEKYFFTKKLLLTLSIVFAIAFPAYGKLEVKDSKAYILSDNVTISFQHTQDDMLRIKSCLNNARPYISPFYMDKEYDKMIPAIKDDSIILGSYEIKEIIDGYALFQNGKKLYSSLFTKEGQVLKEFKQGLDNDYFYGMGEAYSRLALINTAFTLRQESKYGDQACLYIPFYFSNSGSAFYYNANTDDKIKFGPKGKSEVTYSTEYPSIDYYYYNDESPKKIVSRFYNFSDSKSLLPKWVFGYIQSKYGYKNENEVYALIENFKKNNIPLSAVVLDLQWFKKMGDLDWDRDSWPDPKKLDDYLEKNDIKLITISEPFYTSDSKNYKEFESNNIFATYKNGKIINWGDWWCFGAPYGAIVNPIAEKAPEVLGAKYIQMSNSGIDAFWTDLGEPENTTPEAYFNTYSEKEFHNYYNREWSKLIYNSMKNKFPDKRMFILSRSGFTGSAKYGVSIWSGDSSSNFNSLKKQTALGINSGLSGFSFWGSDVGGFMGIENKPPTKDLFIRWFQFGAFTPVFRAHGSQAPREPWAQDSEATAIIKSVIAYRYKILPYIYSTAYETYKNGIPMMRPLMLEHPKDLEVLTNSSEFYFGDYILVAPVASPIDKEPETSVYLPEGTWYDINTLEAFKSGQYRFKSTLNKIPVFYKEGAIIPTKVDTQNELIAIPSDKESTFTWYDDDGISNNFEKGEFEAIIITLNKTGIRFDNVKNPKTLNVNILKSAVNASDSIKKVSTSETKDFYVITIQLEKGSNEFKF